MADLYDRPGFQFVICACVRCKRYWADQILKNVPLDRAAAYMAAIKCRRCGESPTMQTDHYAPQRLADQGFKHIDDQPDSSAVPLREVPSA